MPSKSDKKIRLFKRQSANFKSVKESLPNFEVSLDIPDLVLCPICLKVISLATEEDNPATVEHAPSAKLGGKIIGLTCRNCNSTQGSTLDSKLIEYYKISQSLKGNGTNFSEAKVRVNNSLPINVKFNVSADNSWRIIPLEKNSNPKVVAHINEILSHTSTTPQVTISLNLQVVQPPSRIIRIALIRAAYLIAFGQFGYGFVVNPALNYIRNLLVDPDDETLYPHGVMFSYPISDEHLGVSIITEPVEMRAYLVVFDISDGGKQIDRIGVILPGWSKNPIDLYNYLNTINGQQIQISTQKIADEIDFIKDFPLAALHHWNMLFS